MRIGGFSRLHAFRHVGLQNPPAFSDSPRAFHGAMDLRLMESRSSFLNAASVSNLILEFDERLGNVGFTPWRLHRVFFFEIGRI